MEIKLIENLSNDEYHNGEKYKAYWSSSNLKSYLDTPREAYYQKYVAEKKDSSAFEFGSQLHDFFASKHLKGLPFEWNVFELPINKSTGEPYGKATKAYQEAICQVKNPISSNDMESIIDIWDMIKRSDYGWYFQKEILNKGLSEASFFVDGIHKYKYRPDVVNDKYIFDYKTVSKNYWDVQKLNYRIKELGYDISAAMYQYFEHQRTGIWKPFIIVWILKEPPYDILISDISEYCFENIGDGEVLVNNGANVFIKLKDQHEVCEMSKNWPGIANQFDEFCGVRIPKFSPKFERNFEQFEIENNEF
jgi:hypothetical protein